MKKILFTAAMLLAVFVASAQNKRIAILETVDRESKVPYGVKLMLRTNLTHAISSTAGYEGYDRIDMSSVSGGQDFLRTGVLSDEQVKYIGKTTEAAAILIAEVAEYDAGHIIITAKLLNAGTAAIETSASPKVVGTSPETIGQACTELMSELLVAPMEKASAKSFTNTWRTLMEKVATNVTMRFEGGGIHIGDTSNPGMVLQYYANGSFYCGENGYGSDDYEMGMFIAADGDEVVECPGGWVYIGQFQNSKKSGTGFVFSPKGDLLYAGDFRDNKPIDTYPGTYSDADMYTFAIQDLDEGDVYVGMLENGERNDVCGLYLWANGDAWYGSWKNGQQSNEGIHLFYDGSYLNGIWKDGGFVMTRDQSIKRTRFAQRLNAVAAHANIKFKDGSSSFGEKQSGWSMDVWVADSIASFYCGDHQGSKRNGAGMYVVVTPNGHLKKCPKGWAYVGKWKESQSDDTLGCIYDRGGNVVYIGEIRSYIPTGKYPNNYPELDALSFSVLEYEDGSFYLGELVNEVPSGMGLYIWPDDDAWFGYWKEGVRNGRGLQMSNDGTFVEGLWKDNEYAMSMEEYARKQKEAVPWTESLKSLTAKFRKNEYGGVNIGDFEYGTCLQTYGVDNIDGVYIGHIVKGQRDIHGTLILLNDDEIPNCPGGKVYVGGWKKGEKHGKACWVYDGNGKLIYYGKFKKDKPVGPYPSPESSMTDRDVFHVISIDGDKYIGQTISGKVESVNGLYIWENGTAWYGFWRDGKPSRYGLWINSNGTWANGKWNEIMQSK